MFLAAFLVVSTFCETIAEKLEALPKKDDFFSFSGEVGAEVVLLLFWQNLATKLYDLLSQTSF
jgi:hypothetical protein